MVGPGASDRGRDMAAVACRRVSSVIRLHQPSPRMNRRRSSRVASPAAISASPVANEMAAPVEGVVTAPGPDPAVPPIAEVEVPDTAPWAEAVLLPAGVPEVAADVVAPEPHDATLVLAPLTPPPSEVDPELVE